MNQPKRDESTQNQNDRKIKRLEKLEKYLANSLNNREEFREISVKNVVSQDGFIKIFL